MSEEKGIFTELYDALFGKSWKMWVGAILLSTFSICLYIIMSPWGASGGVLNWGQQVINPILNKTVTAFTENRYAMLNILILFGAFSSALFAKQFAIRIPPYGELVKGLIGGLLMGFGAVIGSSCTLGGFYSGWPSLSVGAFIFTFGLVIGTFFAVLYLLWEAEKHPSISTGDSKTFLSGGKWQPIAGAIVFILGLVFIYFLYPDSTVAGAVVLIGFSFFGLLIGFVLQRSRFCIVRALREPFMTGESSAAVAVMGGIIVGLFGFIAMKFLSPTPTPTMFIFPNLWISGLIGGIIFGIGMTVAGGCVVGSLWRSGEGQVKLWFSVLGMFIAMPITAIIKDDILGLLPAEMTTNTMYLPDVFGGDLIGYIAAALFVLAIIALWYIIVKWNERTGKLARM